VAQVGDRDAEATLAGLGHLAGGGGAPAVGEDDRFPHPQPAYGDGVVRLVTADLDDGAGLGALEGIDEVDGERHPQSAQCGLNASRSLPNIDFWGACT
jgi:hypothetical protein